MRVHLGTHSLTALLVAGALLGAAGAATAQTPASVTTTPEPSMSATPTPVAHGVTAPQPAGALVVTPSPATPPPLPDHSPTLAPAAPSGARPVSNGPTITISAADGGKTFQASINQQIVLQLGASLNWTVAYDPQGILLAVPGVNSLARGTQAILYAAAPGTVTITAQGRPICAPTQPCPQFISQFRATVVVSAGPSAQQPSGPTTTQQTGASAPVPSGAITLPNTGGQGPDAPLTALLAGAAVLALAGGVTWRCARGAR